MSTASPAIEDLKKRKYVDLSKPVTVQLRKLKQKSKPSPPPQRDATKRRKLEDCIKTFSYSIKFKSNEEYEVYKNHEVKSDFICRNIVKTTETTQVEYNPIVSIQLYKPTFTLPTLIEVVFNNIFFKNTFLSKFSNVRIFSNGLINSVPSSRAVFSINYDTLYKLIAHQSVIYVNLIDHDEYGAKNKFTILHYPSFRYLQVSVYYPSNDESTTGNDSNVNAVF